MSSNNNPTPQRTFEKPVAWLLGKQLLNSLKGILLYSAYGGKIDPRDWMTAKSFAYATDKDEFWFDYLSDSGDGTRTVYSIAYLAMCNLWTKLSREVTELPAADLELSFSKEDQTGHTFALPRGEFLFFGGDTAYHAAEYMTLLQRIQKPFRYAYEDLRAHQLIADDDPRRNIFGIPGNHDYYDQLDGFRRQFRKPVREEGPPPPAQAGPKNAQLSIPAFKRIQEASYVAIDLPFGWSMWGLDTESPVSDRHKVHLDRRQKHFFQSLCPTNGEFHGPDKLILATCSPSTVFGRLADAEDPKVAGAMTELGLKQQPFLPAAERRDLSGTGDAKLSQGQCRLDLSGDVHHYARYWGPASASDKAENKDKKVSANSYASVVSGAGGAFHHPSTTFDGEISEQVLYPPRNESREAVAKSLFKFWNIFTGGRVWLFGLIIAFTVYLGAAVTPSSRQFISQFRLLQALNLTQPEAITPIVLRPGAKPCDNVKPFRLWTVLQVVDDVWRPPADCSQGGYSYFFSSLFRWPRDIVLGQICIWTSLILILVTLGLAFTKIIFTDESAFQKGRDPARVIWPILILTTILVALGLLSLEPYRNYFTPFASSLLVLYSIIAAATSIVLGMRYADYRYKKSFAGGGGSRYLDIVCWILAVAVVAFALLLFGRNNAPAFLISDILFVIVLVGSLAALVFLLPFLVAADLLYGQSRFFAVPGKLLIGSWHFVLQLLVPFILVRNGNYIVWLVVAVLLLASLLAEPILKNNWRILLVIAWIVYGALMLFLPKIVSSLYLTEGMTYRPAVESLTGWWGLLAALIAGVFGAVICCLWTGWYFAVCFAFNGHNNEVGGAARIERFKQFIRFRLTKEGLTGYVIAVDDVDHIGEVRNGRTMDGSDLKPKLVDVFHLVPKQ